jgi:hypothetical protein
MPVTAETANACSFILTVCHLNKCLISTEAMTPPQPYDCRKWESSDRAEGVRPGRTNSEAVTEPAFDSRLTPTLGDEIPVDLAIGEPATHWSCGATLANVEEG